MKMLLSRPRQWLFVALALILSAFCLPAIAALSLDEALSTAAADPDGAFWLLGLGTMAQVRTSKNLRELQAKKATSFDAAQSIHDIAAAANRDLTDDEAKAFKAHSDDMKTLQASIDRETILLAEQADSAAGLSANHVGALHERAEDDPKRGFESLGQFAAAVTNHYIMGSTDNRLRIGASVPGTASNEGIGGDGGFLIPPSFSQKIWQLSVNENSLVEQTTNYELEGNSMVFPKDETTPWGGSGVQAYWQNELSALTGSKPVIGTDMLRLHKLTALVPVSNEMLSDASFLGSYIMQKVPVKMRWKTNEAILFGSGVGQPLGALSAVNNASIVVAKESGQATGTILQPNISKMFSRLIADADLNPIWLANPDVRPMLDSLTVGNIPIFLPFNSGLTQSPGGTLYGRPLIFTEHCKSASSQGDLVLMDLKNGYHTATKAGGIQTDTSMHLYFVADATAFRFIYRIDGKPILSAPVTPPNSSNTRSHFVMLGAR